MVGHMPTNEDRAVEFLRKPPIFMTWAPFTTLAPEAGPAPYVPETRVHAWEVVPLFPGAVQYGPKAKTLCGKAYECPKSFTMKAGEHEKCEGCEAVAAKPLVDLLEDVSRETAFRVLRAFAHCENEGDMCDAAQAVLRKVGSEIKVHSYVELANALDQLHVEALR